MAGYPESGPSDDQMAQLKKLKAENLKLKADATAILQGHARSRALRKVREAEAQRIFGNWRRR